MCCLQGCLHLLPLQAAPGAAATAANLVAKTSWCAFKECLPLQCEPGTVSQSHQRLWRMAVRRSHRWLLCCRMCHSTCSTRQQQQQQQYMVLWQQGLSAVVEAWQGLVTMVHSTRAVGLYQLMPDLIKAIDVWDPDAATCFKQVRVSPRGRCCGSICKAGHVCYVGGWWGCRGKISSFKIQSPSLSSTLLSLKQMCQDNFTHVQPLLRELQGMSQ